MLLVEIYSHRERDFTQIRYNSIENPTIATDTLDAMILIWIKVTIEKTKKYLRIVNV